MLAGLAGGASAQESAPPGPKDPSLLPGWQAIGRLEAGGNGFCTGTLIEPDLVLTAAHCAYGGGGNPRPAKRFEFRAGLRGAEFVAEGRGIEVVVHPDYQPGVPLDGEKITHDLALVRLEKPIDPKLAAPVGLHPDGGQARVVWLLSYGRGIAPKGTLPHQRICPVLGRNGAVIAAGCHVVSGASGSPVLAVDGDALRLVAVVSASGRVNGRSAAFAMDLLGPVAELKRLMRKGTDQAGGGSDPAAEAPDIESEAAQRGQ